MISHIFEGRFFHRLPSTSAVTPFSGFPHATGTRPISSNMGL